MRLIKFKVENFRSVVDSGWIDAERVTALIGVNESGKTNLLLPLWKLNPAHEGELKPTSDYPKSKYAAVREHPEKFWFIHAYFDVSELADELGKMTGASKEALSVAYVARNFSGYRYVGFPNFKEVKTVGAVEVKSLIDNAIVELAAMSQLTKEGTLKESSIKLLERMGEQCAAVTCPCKFPPRGVRVRPSQGRTDEASQVYGRADYWRTAGA